MGIVTFLVDAADQGLETVAESQFAATSSGLGTVIMLAATLAIILLFVNMSLQIKPMDGADLIPLLVKIGLINAFAFNWVNFNFVSGLIIDGLDSLASTMIGSITGESGSGSAYFAERFDQVLNDLADHANEIGNNLPWMTGAVLSVFFTALLAVVGGAAGVILVLAKAMVTFLIGLAPIMIALSMFRATQDYFHRWLAAIVSWSVYPVVIAGTMSVIFGLFHALQSRVGSAEGLDKIGAALPFLAVVFVSLGMVLAIPLIVRTLTGDINAGWAASMVGNATQQAARRSMQRDRPTPTDRPTSNVPSSTEKAGPWGTGASANRSGNRPSTGAAERLKRMQERNNRLGK